MAYLLVNGQSGDTVGDRSRGDRRRARRAGSAGSRGAGSDDGVVVFAGLDWWYHNRAHSDFQLARRLAVHRRVLLINSIGTRLPRPGRTTSFGTRIRNKLRSVARGVRRPVPELPEFYVYSPLVLPAYGSPLGRAVASSLVRVQVGAVRWWLGMSRPSVIVTPPTAWPAVSRMRRSGLVFNRSDKHSAFPECDPTAMRAYEDRLMQESDAVLYVCKTLQAEDAPLVGDRAVFLDHGVDPELFHPATAPARELAALRERSAGRGRIIGYFGTLRGHTVDADLLLKVAQEFPDDHVVLVGPCYMDIAALEAQPNVTIFGAQDHERIPAFGVGFDVAIMPWLDNEWIRNCNPIKLKEYLALGLPVVTTYFPEAEHWPVRTAKGDEEFVAEIRAALADPGDAAFLRASVSGETWAARGTQLVEVLDRCGRTAPPVVPFGSVGPIRPGVPPVLVTVPGPRPAADADPAPASV